MNTDRINELKKFVEDFNDQLEESHKRYEMDIEREKEILQKKQKEKPKEKKKTFTENIFKDPPAWKPNKFHNDYFEDLKILEPKYFLSDWDKERIDFSKRTFTKAQELENKDVRYTISHGREFGTVGSDKLGKNGKHIIGRFIEENKEREKLLLQKEEDIYNYKRSKHELELNKWKFNNHHPKELDKIKVDEVYFFKTDPKPDYLLKKPFRIPKRDGDYFQKPTAF